MERTTKEDGRYVLFYTWPQDGQSSAHTTTESTARTEPEPDGSVDRGRGGRADAGDPPRGAGNR